MFLLRLSVVSPRIMVLMANPYWRILGFVLLPCISVCCWQNLGNDKVRKLKQKNKKYSSSHRAISIHVNDLHINEMITLNLLIKFMLKCINNILGDVTD